MFLRIMFLLSTALALAPFLMPGQIWVDLFLLAISTALASLILLLRQPVRAAPRQMRKVRPSIVIDGSNVMHWKDEVPKIETLREVIDKVKAQGYSPGVVFDANVGYKISGGYLHDRPLAKMLNLPVDSVMVVDRGTPADPIILETARSLQARVVTNDRYRDWAEAHPEVLSAGTLVSGGYRNGALWLDLDAVAA